MEGEREGKREGGREGGETIALWTGACKIP